MKVTNTIMRQSMSIPFKIQQSLEKLKNGDE